MDIESGEVKIKVSLKTKFIQFILNHTMLCMWILLILLLIFVIIFGSSP